tara:strand:+ start:199 stop:858 length:660 start_codon:yes stop_codon:yes gene_type:complete
MKLLFENWRKYLTEEVTPPQNYSSVNINRDTAKLLISKAKEVLGEVPKGFAPDKEKGRWPHHMTINMGPLLDNWKEGDSVTLEIDGWGIIDSIDKKEKPIQAMAFRVNKLKLPALIKNKVPHITTLVGPKGKPFHSNKIQNWTDITPFSIKGTVVAATQQKKKEKPKKQKPQGQDDPVNFVKGLVSRNISPDKIKDIIMKKFNKPEEDALEIMRGAGIL